MRDPNAGASEGNPLLEQNQHRSSKREATTNGLPNCRVKELNRGEMVICAGAGFEAEVVRSVIKEELAPPIFSGSSIRSPSAE
jgi:hypothetical protein